MFLDFWFICISDTLSAFADIYTHERLDMSQDKRDIVDSNWDRIHKTHYAVTSSYVVTSPYTTLMDDPRFKLTASYSNGSRIRMIVGEIFETKDGTYQITYQNGPLSCSVAGGMSLLITFPDNTSENVFFPPGYNFKRVEDCPEKQQSQYVPSSGINAEALKEAIEDAKQVRRKALENAKEALEEAFANHPKINTVKQKCNDAISSDEMVNVMNDGPSTIKGSVDEQAFINYTKQLGKHTAQEALEQKKKAAPKEVVKKTITFPKHLSYEGSVVLCVMLSMNEVAHPYLSNLPSSDQALIRSLITKDINIDKFEVRFDENKDFILAFSTPSYDNEVVLTMFNSVAHPRPEDLKGAGVVPVEKDGDKIEVGGKIVLNRKGIERLIGVDNKPKQDGEEDPLPRRQSVAGRNAFEIRTDILQLSMDYAIYSKSHLSPDEVLNIAKKFYTFVENKR